MVLLQIQESHDVRMPRLNVDSEAALALASTLVHVASGVVEHAEHRHQTVAVAVGATNIGSGSANVMHRKTNATSVLGDLSTLLYVTTKKSTNHVISSSY